MSTKKLQEAFEAANKKNLIKENQQNKQLLYSNRTFALGLIGLASIYIFIMILQAFNLNDGFHRHEEEDSSYESGYSYEY
jgi:hypothetical protein